MSTVHYAPRTWVIVEWYHCAKFAFSLMNHQNYNFKVDLIFEWSYCQCLIKSKRYTFRAGLGSLIYTLLKRLLYTLIIKKSKGLWKSILPYTDFVQTYSPQFILIYSLGPKNGNHVKWIVFGLEHSSDARANYISRLPFCSKAAKCGP